MIFGSAHKFAAGARAAEPSELDAILSRLQVTTVEFVDNLGNFFTHRKAIDAVFLSVCLINRWPDGRLEAIVIPSVSIQTGGTYNPAYLQQRVGGGPVRSLDELYEAGGMCQPFFVGFLHDVAEGLDGVEVKLPVP